VTGNHRQFRSKKCCNSTPKGKINRLHEEKYLLSLKAAKETKPRRKLRGQNRGKEGTSKNTITSRRLSSIPKNVPRNKNFALLRQTIRARVLHLFWESGTLDSFLSTFFLSLWKGNISKSAWVLFFFFG
jgi:hypothetical protein